MKTQALELFAGTGGQAFALKAAGVKTIGYCEIDKGNAAVLRSNMEQGRLDKAPIFPDVTTLNKQDLRSKRVDMIAGGFPCLGLSGIGSRRGLYGDSRSNLVKHVFRLVNELKPSYVWLENVPNILRDKNYKDLIGRFTRMGYRCAFIVSTASQVGASHLRARWFMLCMRKNAVPFTPKNKVAKLSRFFRQRVSKLLPRDRYGHWARSICHSFGNSVVPAQANLALVTLTRALSMPTSALEAVPFSEIDRMKPTVALSPSKYYQHTSYTVPSTDCHGKGFTIYPPRPPRSYESKMTLPMLTKPFHSRCSPTPCTSRCSAGPLPTMSRRTKGDAVNFLLSATEMWGGPVPTNHGKRMQKIVSDEYWAASMGFPKDWIRPVLRTYVA